MKLTLSRKLSSTFLCLLVILLSSCQPAAEPVAENAAEADPASAPLATARVSARLSAPGTAAVHGHNDLQYVVEESPSADSLDATDTLLAAQATCAVFVAEKAAQELDVNLTGATASTLFDEQGRQVRVFLDLPGVDDDAILELANHIRQRCPVYTTLAQAQSVDFTPGQEFVLPAGETAMVSATINEFGRADVMAQEQTFLMDSVPPLDGPNLELNPLDMMLGGLAACGMFAIDDIEPLADATVVLEADFNPSGVRDLGGENPRMQAMRIIVEGQGAGEASAVEVEAQIREQCPLYQTLEGTMTMEVSTVQVNRQS